LKGNSGTAEGNICSLPARRLIAPDRADVPRETLGGSAQGAPMFHVKQQQSITFRCRSCEDPVQHLLVVDRAGDAAKGLAGKAHLGGGEFGPTRRAALARWRA
jgi:hypothetical protein